MAQNRPEILAPAGDEAGFLAALAAGADAVYLGLKHFSARMEAENFSISQLGRLTSLAHENGAKVYVAMNTLIKPDEGAKAGRLISRLANIVKNDGLIIQDLALLNLARQAGFEGGLFLSTLANVSSPAGLLAAAKLGAARVILPRELSIDEIRAMGASCPQGVGLEVFVQGALCYCVSGRCYWSSYMGGKSGLRGRCVQPCRRLYDIRTENASRNAENNFSPARYFSCQDLELGVLAKTLLDIPQICSWKIEGRKKGPHYVYHAVSAYRILRDSPNDPAAKKEAADILRMALGRPGAHGRFLPQREVAPMAPQGQTASGLLAGKIRVDPSGKCVLKPRFNLLANDYLRIGTEDERWHATISVKRNTPKGGSLALAFPRHKTPKTGVPVFLVDRRDPELARILRVWREKLERIPPVQTRESDFQPVLPKPAKPRPRRDMLVMRKAPRGKSGKYMPALWLSARSARISPTFAPRFCWWLPPVAWPDEEEFYVKLARKLLSGGARHFVCNAPWQADYFASGKRRADLDLIAGPFCNAANPLALLELSRLGFDAAFASPELSGRDLSILAQESPLPLGLVISGFWPVGLSRFGLSGIKPGDIFRSPKGEPFWSQQHGQNIWLYPGWPLNLESRRKELARAGFSFFAQLEETPPKNLSFRERPGLFNWDGGLL